MITGPINFTRYGDDLRRFELELNQPPRRAKTVKIHLVTIHSLDSGAPERSFLVKSHTRAGATKHVMRRVGRFIDAKVPTQDELVAALQSGVVIEDATAKPASQEKQP